MVYILGYLMGVLNIGTSYLYIIFVALSLMIVGVSLINRRNSKKEFPKYYMRHVVFLIFMWWYGFLIGLIRGNEISFIIRNFAGLLLYSYYFLLHISKAKMESVIRMTVAVGITICACVLIARGLYAVIGAPEVYKYYGLYWLTGKIDGNDGNFTRTSIRIASESGIYILFSIAMYKILYCKKWLYLVLAGVVAIQLIWTRSSGYILALVFLIGLFGIGMCVNIKRDKIHLILVVLCIFMGILIVVGSNFNFVGAIMTFFSSEDEGNAIRYEQINEILRELSLIGRGLGATFETVNVEKQFPYSIEVIYLNIFHKFGVVAIGYLIILIKTYWNCLMNICNNHNVYEMYICLGLMSYAVISLGNPVLFAPQNVIFHTIVIYILERVKENNEVQKSTS